MRNIGTLRAALTIMICGLSGCVWETQDMRRRDLGVAPRAAAKAGSAAFRDTIGELATYEGYAPMHVQGYGLVVGLGRNGSSECPPRVFERLIQQIQKRYPLTSSRVDVPSLTPEQMIRDKDTAVVLVEGYIAPAACVGARFDVMVRALPETGVRSLRGGRLFTCELEYAVAVSSQTSLASGHTLAIAAGPLFMNPFAIDEDAATRADETMAVVLGGGRVTESRRIRLVLAEPSYSAARRIEERINAKFGNQGRVADAVSPAFVQITIPPDYHDDTDHFLLLLRHLFLPVDSGFVPKRCQELAEELQRPDAPHADIALCFEAVGRSALPFLTPLYVHKKDYVAFHAAAAGLEIEDELAVDVLARLARDPDSEFRFQAIRALGRARTMRAAALPLRGLLDDADPRVRIAAYEELARREDPSIERTIVGGDNFILDVAGGSGAPLIYAKRSGQRRLAILGEGINCRPPLFYRSPDGSVVINAHEDDRQLTLVRYVPQKNSASPPVTAVPDLAPLIRLMGSDAQQFQGRVTGLGIDYTTLVHAMYTLCRDQSVNAQFILEEENLAELFGPPERQGRPESEK